MGPPPGEADDERSQPYEDTLLLVLTLLIGILVGLVVVAFILVTERLGARLFPPGGIGWHRLAIPCAGALVSGALLYRWFPSARGSGIPQTKSGLLLERGFISLRTVVGKFVCSSISLASGIALGREGPTVHIGAGIASVLGRRLGLGPRGVQALLPVGAAAALAAAFNTPISAVLFTLEEIIGDLHAPVLGSIVLSSATSWAVLHLMLGDEPLFHVPSYQLVHPLELLVYALLGVVGGFISVAFVRLLLWLRARFLSLPPTTQWAQPMGGGLVVGLLGWMVPAVLGVGYGHVGDALNGRLLLGAMLLLLGLKLVSTAACYASGNAGGIFGPSLFIGAMLGGSVGGLAHSVVPDMTGSPGAYALVGMGTAFAGIVRAPMTSVIMIFEITRDYSIIVPLMIANLLSYFISQRLQPSPVYEALLHQDHMRLPTVRLLTMGRTVAQAMRRVPRVLHGDSPVRDVVREVTDVDPGSGPWPVVDGGRLLGMIDGARIEAAATSEPDAVLRDLVPTATSAPRPHVHPDHPVDVALQRMGRSGLSVVPVVSRDNADELLGTVALADLPGAYASRDDDTTKTLSRSEASSLRALLTVAVVGVSGLSILGLLLAQHYYRGRVETAARFYQEGLDLVRQGRDANAAEQFRSALSLTGADQYRLALGLALARSGRAAEATTYLDEILRRDQGNGAANLAVARLARSSRDLPRAIAAYRRAIAGSWPPAEAGERQSAWFELVEALREAGQPRQAIAELLQLAAQPVEPPVLGRIGHTLLALGAPREASDVFRQMAVGAPADAAAPAGLGEAEMAQQDYQAARAAYARAVQLEPGDARWRDRLDVCDQVIELDPTSRGLRARDRYLRSRRLVDRTLTAAAACSWLPTEGDGIALLEEARRFAATSNRRSGFTDATDDGIRLALDLWTRLEPGCQTRPEHEALTRVMARLQGQ